MAPLTAKQRLSWTAALFAVALICIGVASATHVVAPVFVAWVPLLAVPWLLTRPEAGSRQTPAPSPSPSAESGAGEALDPAEPTGRDPGEPDGAGSSGA